MRDTMALANMGIGSLGCGTRLIRREFNRELRQSPDANKCQSVSHSRVS